jgi:hypothetical protein
MSLQAIPQDVVIHEIFPFLEAEDLYNLKHTSVFFRDHIRSFLQGYGVEDA